MSKYPDMMAVVRRDAFCTETGIELVVSAPGSATTRVRVEPRHLNFGGVCHGGLTFTLADAAFGIACNARGIAAAGIDCHMTYNRAVKLGETLTATATELTYSPKIATYRVDVVRGDGKLVAAMTGTAFVSGKPLEE